MSRAKPLSPDAREVNYIEQRKSVRLTARQLRRWRQKRNRHPGLTDAALLADAQMFAAYTRDGTS